MSDRRPGSDCLAVVRAVVRAALEVRLRVVGTATVTLMAGGVVRGLTRCCGARRAECQHGDGSQRRNPALGGLHRSSSGLLSRLSARLPGRWAGFQLDVG